MMPTKERSARPTRASRLPGVDHLQWLRTKDFNAPAGEWHIDKPLGVILSKGLAPRVAAAKRPYRVVRGQVVGCVRFALIGAMVAYSQPAERSRAREEIQSLQDLSSRLEAFLDRAAELEELLIRNQLPATLRRRVPELRAAKKAEAFNKELSSLILAMRPFGTSRGDATDHLANLFVQGMRDLWRGLCEQPAPRGGGSLLISLSAATCRDTRILLEHDSDDLEGWLSVKFRTQIRPS
jgi:hypothetical protein